MKSTVTFGVIALNEQNYLPDLLSDLWKQTYPHDLIEVVLVDGASTDDTRKLMSAFQKEYQDDFRAVKVLNNEKRVQPAGWNVVINNFTADILLRVDAHARLPHDFVAKNVACINSGEYVCGGPRENIIDKNTPWKRTLLTAEQSMFGSGFATYRQETAEKRYVKSVFHAAYRKEVIERVGLFNEALIRTEDNEYHYRVRQEGYKICYDPAIYSCYQTRNSLKGMLKQKYQNGFWIGKTLFICPGCISAFHLVPAAFVMASLVALVMEICGISAPLKVLWGTYGAANLGMTAASLISKKNLNAYDAALPLIFLLLHICYGVGTMNGIVKSLAGRAQKGT